MLMAIKSAPAPEPIVGDTIDEVSLWMAKFVEDNNQATHVQFNWWLIIARPEASQEEILRAFDGKSSTNNVELSVVSRRIQSEGSDLDEIARQAAFAALADETPCWFEVEGVVVLVPPRATPNEVMAAYHSATQ